MIEVNVPNHTALYLLQSVDNQTGSRKATNIP